MKIETEIKLALKNDEVESVAANIEKLFTRKKSDPFRQITHQFFFEDWTTQTAFPRIRNEEDGSITLTVKTKTKEGSEFFKRIELETTIGNAGELICMMPYFGFSKKITWEKKRQSFTKNDNTNGGGGICFYLDETPMGWFLEIEAEESSIENAISLLCLQESKRFSKPYLGLWEDYKKEHGILEEDMIFKMN